MKNKSIKKNYIYNLILTTLNILFPLIISPYISKVLGPENIGKINYATSIMNWFILFASFGIPRYGVREIARNRRDKKKLSNCFWNLIFIQAILSFVSLIIYLIIICCFKEFRNDFLLYIIMIAMLILNIFSIDWFYQGVEEYGYITIRNIIVKSISLVSIFLMIKNKDDFILYALINIFSLGFNNIFNYLHVKKYIFKKNYCFQILYYINELKVYFFTTLIVSLYTQFDQVIIGAYSVTDLAYYMRSKMVLGVGMSIVNSIITVFIPRTTFLIEHNYEEYKAVVCESINYIYLLAFPCFIGLFLLAKPIMLFLGGVEFLPASFSLKITSILVIITSIGTWQINQILLAYRKERYTFIIQLICAIISIFLNIIITPKYTYIGASIIWVITEFILVFLEGTAIKFLCKDIKIKYVNLEMLKYLFSSLVMGVGVGFITILNLNSFLKVFLATFTGVLIYIIMLILLRDKLALETIKPIILKVKGKCQRFDK